VKLNLGCGNVYKEGWINLDIDKSYKVDIVADIRLNLPFKDRSFDFVLLDNVIEHLTYFQGYKLLREIYRILEDKGILQLETQNLRITCLDYINKTLTGPLDTFSRFYGGPGGGVMKLKPEMEYSEYKVHKSGWDIGNKEINDIELVLTKIGFQEVKEYKSFPNQLAVRAFKTRRS